MKRIKTKYRGVYYIQNQKKEKVFYIVYRKGGRLSKQIEEKVGKDKEGMTEAKANNLRSLRILGKQKSNQEKRDEAKVTSVIDFASLFALYSEKKPRTDVPMLLKELGPKKIVDLSTHDVERLKRSMEAKGRKPATISRNLKYFKAALNWGEMMGYCKKPSGLKIVMPKVDNIKTEVLTDKQLLKLVQVLDEYPFQTISNVMRVALYTGMRKTAILNLKWMDIDFENDVILLRGEVAKKKKTEHIPMSRMVKELFHKMSDEQPNKKEYIFLNQDGEQLRFVEKQVAEIRDMAGLPKDFRPMHGLRHNYASRLASSGKVDMYTLQKLLTHSTPQMTQRYAHLHDEALKRAASVADDVLQPKKKP